MIIVVSLKKLLTKQQHTDVSVTYLGNVKAAMDLHSCTCESCVLLALMIHMHNHTVKGAEGSACNGGCDC